MEIQELIGIKSQLTTKDSKNYLHDLMSKYGFSQVGSGSRSRVYKKSHDFVVKVFKQTDQAYKDWVLLSIKYRDNPHFPRIIGKPVKIGEGYYAIRLETLQEVDYSDYVILSKLLAIEDPDWKDQIMLDPKLSDYVDQFPNLIKAISVIKRFEDRHRDYMLDIHRDNIMMRNRTPVFIDPFFI
jgi:hypothetical protein